MSLTSLEQQIEKLSYDKLPFRYGEKYVKTADVLGLLACPDCNGKGYEIVTSVANFPDSIPPAHVGKIECKTCGGSGEKYVCIPRKQLEPFYDNLKKHTELDVQSGYHVSKERKEVLKILEWLLEESK